MAVMMTISILNILSIHRLSDEGSTGRKGGDVMIGKGLLGGGADYGDSIGREATQSLATGDSVSIIIGNQFCNCCEPEACENKAQHSGTDCIDRYCKIYNTGITLAKAQLGKVLYLVPDAGTRCSKTEDIDMCPRGIELRRVTRNGDHLPIIVHRGPTTHTKASRERAVWPRWQRGKVSGAE